MFEAPKRHLSTDEAAILAYLASKGPASAQMLGDFLQIPAIRVRELIEGMRYHLDSVGIATSKVTYYKLEGPQYEASNYGRKRSYAIKRRSKGSRRIS